MAQKLQLQQWQGDHLLDSCFTYNKCLMKWNLIVYQVQPYSIGFSKYFVFMWNYCYRHVKWGTWALRSCKAFGDIWDIWVCAPQFNLGVALTCIVPFVQCCHICHALQHNTPKNCLWAWLQPYTNKLTLVWCGQQRGEYYGVCFCILRVQWSLQIYILDVKDHSILYCPGARPSKLDQITPISWN